MLGKNLVGIIPRRILGIMSGAISRSLEETVGIISEKKRFKELLGMNFQRNWFYEDVLERLPLKCLIEDSFKFYVK